MKVKKHDTSDDLTWCFDAQGKLYIQWVRVPDGLGYWKHTGHTTLKNAKEKAFPDSNPPTTPYGSSIKLQYKDLQRLKSDIISKSGI